MSITLATIGTAAAGITAAAKGAKALSSTVDSVSGRLRAAKAKSYIEYSKVTTIEPPTVVDEELVNLPILPAILQSVLTQFTVFYIQAATIHLNLGRINIVGKLDPLNPNRSSGLPSFPNVSLESEDNTSEFLEFSNGLKSFDATGLEDFKINVSQGKNIGGKGTKTDGLIGQSDKMFKETAPLSVGRVFDFEIHDGDKSAKVPLTVRLRTATIKKDPLLKLLSLKQVPRGFFARIKGFMEGDKEFWRDVVLNRDLVKEHRDALLKDSTGLYKERLNVARKNKRAALSRLEPSIATYATLYIVSKDTILNLTSKYGVDFSRPKVREKVFADSGAMIIAVVDYKDYETVTFYYHSLENSRELTFTQLQREVTSSKGADLTDIIQTLGIQPGRI